MNNENDQPFIDKVKTIRLKGFLNAINGQCLVIDKKVCKFSSFFHEKKIYFQHGGLTDQIILWIKCK